MTNLDLVYKAIEYIEEHLKEEIKVKTLSEVSCFSLFHFIRVFGKKTLMSPKDYIVRRKISEASKQLLTTDKSVLSIALEYGFNSHETFIRAFKRVHGTTPLKLRTDLNAYRITEAMSMNYLRFIDRYGMIEPKPFELSHQNLFGYSVTNGGKQIAELNKISHLFKSDHLYMIEKQLVKDVLIFYGSVKENEFFKVSIEGGQYACFGSFQDFKDIALVYDYVYDVWYPRSGYVTSSKDKTILSYDSVKEVYSLLVPIKEQ